MGKKSSGRKAAARGDTKTLKAGQERRSQAKRRRQDKKANVIRDALAQQHRKSRITNE